MSSHEVNPFQELYVTDSPDPRAFVALFSTFPVRHALALFQPGHVVLKGTQGSGKSMLLNLFRPEIRVAYHTAVQDFPVPAKVRRFVAAGINLTRSGILDIGNRPLSKAPLSDDALFPLYFADFLNYYVVRDILRSVDLLRSLAKAFDSLVAGDKLDGFAEALGEQDCWFGALNGCKTFDELCVRIDKRIEAYRSFHLYNLADMPAHIGQTKTNIGEPIARAAELLRHVGVVPSDTPVFVRIDQVERLYRSDAVRPAVGQQYRRMINKAIGLRDSRVWYRVGTRPYAWEDDLQIFGTDDRLEHLRDFRIIDLDGMLRRQENTRTWIFPDFAEDAFARRLRHVGYHGSNRSGLVRRVFGSTEDPSEAARGYARNSSADRVLKLQSFPPKWKEFLAQLFPNDPLAATMAAAWARQRGRTEPPGKRLNAPPPKGKEPWNRPYWRKERIRQALMQIATRSAQRLKWSGEGQILALSAGNISIFLSICHEIWDAFLRAERRKPMAEQRSPIDDGIHPDVQAVGIQTASVHWYNKVTEQPNGDDRRRLLDVLAPMFKKWLFDDKAMSYPGRNGFSLAIEDLVAQRAVSDFLGDSADYGDLYEILHTTKERDRKQRKKWYLSPILSPYYQLPESHVKEPYYATVPEVVGWLRNAQIVLEGLDYQALNFRDRRPSQGSVPTLFDAPTEEQASGNA